MKHAVFHWLLTLLQLSGNSQRKNAAILDSDDDSSSVSSSSTMLPGRMSVWGTEEVQLHKDSLLEQALDALYEKRCIYVSVEFSLVNEWNLFVLKYVNFDIGRLVIHSVCNLMRKLYRFLYIIFVSHWLCLRL